MANEAVRYLYSSDDPRRWEITDGDITISLTATALHHLYSTGALSEQQKTRRVGELEWHPLAEMSEVIKRVAYGQLLPKLFEREGALWFYQGLSGNLLGPFEGCQMMKWFSGGYLHERLKIFIQTDMLERPTAASCITLEELLLYMSQPTFSSQSLSTESPLSDLRQIHCPPHSWGALLGDTQDIKKLPLSPAGAPVLCESIEPDGEEQSQQDQISAVQSMIQSSLEPALKLFYSQSLSWYYLGQREHCTIHGPFDGERMFSWFQQGWLSLELPIWSTTEIVISINPKDFLPLHEHLKPFRENSFPYGTVFKEG